MHQISYVKPITLYTTHLWSNSKPNERKVNHQIKSHVCANRFYEHIEDQKTAVSLYMDEQFGTWIDDDGGLYYDT